MLWLLFVSAVIIEQDLIGIEGTGGTVWKSSVVLTQWLCTNETIRSGICNGVVLEIGAGT
jgi:Lysine methyltransferase